MTFKDKYPDLHKIIIRLAYDQFLYGGAEPTGNELLNDIRHECPYMDIDRIDDEIRIDIVKFFTRTVEYFYDINKALELVSEKYSHANSHIQKTISNLKKRAIYECFINNTNFDMTIDIFSKSCIRDDTITHNEIEELFILFQNMYWFCRGSFYVDWKLFNPSFMDEPLV